MWSHVRLALRMYAYASVTTDEMVRVIDQRGLGLESSS